mmetsp:Transcript_22421/g.72796  ORF Transcript_22421/g.72796 Transcript_22421/m.72796 type:complete len:224 (-) Transcript_22421:885-1556(-)
MGLRTRWWRTATSSGVWRRFRSGSGLGLSSASRGGRPRYWSVSARFGTQACRLLGCGSRTGQGWSTHRSVSDSTGTGSSTRRGTQTGTRRSPPCASRVSECSCTPIRTWRTLRGQRARVKSRRTSVSSGARRRSEDVSCSTTRAHRSAPFPPRRTLRLAWWTSPWTAARRGWRARCRPTCSGAAPRVGWRTLARCSRSKRWSARARQCPSWRRTTAGRSCGHR